MRVKVRVWFSNCARCVLVVEYALSGCALGFVDVEGGVPGRFEQTEYILHAVYEPAAHGLVPLRSARVPGLAATSFYPTLPESVQAAACLYCVACMQSTEITSRKIKLVGFDWTC